MYKKNNKSRLISAIYKILLLFEDIADPNSKITEQDYLKYLDRIYIRFKGREDEEITDLIKGLIKLHNQLTQVEVKSVVFHMIEVVEKEESEEC